ncbi:MAG: type II secretion system F family protein [Candidatus Sericytochromatia bacterium]|nr:type II secretion system F family protein [Candidatus Sericytochromatia bacterium]
MDPVVLFFVGILSFVAVLLLLLAVAKPKQREEVEGRLKRLKENAERPNFLHTEAPQSALKKDALADANQQLDALFRPAAERRLSERQATEIQLLLQAAGRYHMTPLQVRIWQLKSALLMPLAAIFLTFALLGFNPAVTVLLASGASGGGFFYPIFALQKESSKRRAVILRQLPTTLDLLTVCVEAGLSLQAALQKVVEKTRPNPLREEIDQVLREIQLGRPRGDALKDMARRVGIKEVNSVVLSMVQAEAMGTSVSKSLRVQSEIARDARMQRAQEQAMQAPVKLSFPLVFFIFPVVFIVIFGPVALELFTNWVG